MPTAFRRAVFTALLIVPLLSSTAAAEPPGQQPAPHVVIQRRDGGRVEGTLLEKGALALRVDTGTEIVDVPLQDIAGYAVTFPSPPVAYSQVRWPFARTLIEAAVIGVGVPPLTAAAVMMLGMLVSGGLAGAFALSVPSQGAPALVPFALALGLAGGLGLGTILMLVLWLPSLLARVVANFIVDRAVGAAHTVTGNVTASRNTAPP